MTATDTTTKTGRPSIPFEAVMAYLHSVNMTAETKRSVARRLQDEARREDASIKMREQFRLKKELDLYATYEQDWDGEGGLPISMEALSNVEALLPFLSSRCLLQVDLYPESNGSLLIMWKNKEAGINIGSSTYTYYETKGNKVNGESHLPFDVDDVLEKAELLAA